MTHVAPIDDETAIAAYLAAHRDATPFHDRRWLRAVERGCGQTYHRLAATDGDGNLTGYLPLTHIRSRVFGSALVSTGFAVGGGILADDHASAAQLADAAQAA